MVWDGQLTEKEAAAELRISLRTLIRERTEGHITYLPIRGRIFYLKSDLDEYRERQRCRATGSTSETTVLSGTSSGQSADERSAVQRARQIASKLSLSKQLSS